MDGSRHHHDLAGRALRLKVFPIAASFTTRWSLIALAATPLQDAGAALAQLCECWRPAVLAWLRRHGDAAEAEDLTQAFFVFFLERALPARADPARGRFRAFLYTALRHWHGDQLAHAAAAIRRPMLAPADPTAVAGADDPAADFDRDWAVLLLQRALDRLRRDADRSGRRDLFEAVLPFLTDTSERNDYPRAAAELGLRPNTLAAAISRMRRRLRAAVRAEVADTTASPADVEAELRWLRAALSG